MMIFLPLITLNVIIIKWNYNKSKIDYVALFGNWVIDEMSKVSSEIQGIDRYSLQEIYNYSYVGIWGKASLPTSQYVK